MRKLVVALVIIAPLLGVPAGSVQGKLLPSSQDGAPQTTDGRQGAVKVTITTGGGLFGPVKDSYRVGQRIPVTITMTNTGREPVYVCDSGTLYQDRPQLTKDGQPAPYDSVQELMMKDSETDKTCEKLDVPEPRLLQPGEPAVTDWFILAEGTTPMGDMAWYKPLRPGKYELSTQRRLGCCDGPLVESNKITFEVTP
jgi:hypothetical protein